MRRTKAEREAMVLLQRLHVRKPPVPVRTLAESMGIRVAEESLEDDVSGMLYRRAGGSLILVNRDHPSNRRRFSLAHEIGHLLLHNAAVFIDKKVRIDFRDSRSALGVDLDEIQANQFAAALLMPEQWVLEQVNAARARRNPPTDENLIAELAAIFEVSEQAIEHRLANLGLLGTF